MLQQIDQHIEAFDEAYLPILTVLRASGWRISDVLALRYDTCLEGEGDKWSLVDFDMHKTRVLGHHVPITAEVASGIRVQTALVRKAFGEQDNPKHYLFPSPHPRCIGLPVRANAVTHAFYRFVTNCRIVGPDGRPFRLRAHAFRHTKAVELINNGMGMSYVQQWLAHLSPEMTLVYARAEPGFAIGRRRLPGVDLVRITRSGRSGRRTYYFMTSDPSCYPARPVSMAGPRR